MSIVDWLIVVLALVVATCIVVGAFAFWYYILRGVDDVDDLPSPPLVRTKIIRPDLAMARAACEAGYISNKEYVDRVAEAQADALALDLSALTQSTLQRPRIRQTPDWNGAA